MDALLLLPDSIARHAQAEDAEQSGTGEGDDLGVQQERVAFAVEVAVANDLALVVDIRGGLQTIPRGSVL